MEGGNKNLGRGLPLGVLFGRVSYNIPKAGKGVSGGIRDWGLGIGIPIIYIYSIYFIGCGRWSTV